MSEIKFPFTYIPDPSKGRPVYNGNIYIGEPCTDPQAESNQIDVYYIDSCCCDGTPTLISQPIKTNAGGVPVGPDGDPIKLVLLIDRPYSISITNKKEEVVYYAKKCSATLTADDLGDLSAYDFKTLEKDTDSATQSLLLEVGDLFTVNERFTGNGGGAKWLVVETSAVTPNGFDIVQSVANPLISFEIQGYPNITPDMLGASGTWQDDSVEALEAWLQYLLDRQDKNIPSQSTFFRTLSSNQLNYSLGGKSYGVSRTLFFGNFSQCKFTEGTIYPVDGFTDLYLCSGDGAFQSDVDFDINFMCRHLTDSYFTGGHIRTRFTGIMHGFTANNVWHDTNQRECIFSGCYIAQYIFGEPGYDDPDNITAFAMNLQGTDSFVGGDVIIQNTKGINVRFGGNEIYAHIYGPNEKAAITFSDVAADNKVEAYIDNSYIQIESSFRGLDLSGTRFLYSKNDPEFNPIRYKVENDSQSVSGLNIQGCTFTTPNLNIDMIGTYISIDISSITGTIGLGITATGGTSGAVGYVVGVDATSVEVKMKSLDYFTDGESLSFSGGATATVDDISGFIGRINSNTIIKDNIFPIKNTFSVNEFSTHFTVKRGLTAKTQETIDLTSFLSQMPGSDIRDAKMAANSTQTPPVAYALAPITSGNVTSVTGRFSAAFTGDMIVDVSLSGDYKSV